MSESSLTIFNPRGRLSQIDYATNAIASSNTTVGLKTKTHVIIITKTSKNIEFEEKPGNSTIFIIDKNIGLSGSGLNTDMMVIVQKARRMAQKFQNNFGETISIRQLVNDLSSYMQEFTQTGGVRPFGVCLFIMGFDNLGPTFFQINPSGSFFKITSNGIGNNSIYAVDFLKKRWNSDLNFTECIRLGIMALRETSDSKLSSLQIQIGIIDKNCEFYILAHEEIENFLKLPEDSSI
mmetsp:Transcript_38973/g.79787  ORF Transcript_38973/g.79787 Transcript_38973/m.79787 type:complete len:236 (-) Transcript_38973:2080-2787(-)